MAHKTERGTTADGEREVTSKAELIRLVQSARKIYAVVMLADHYAELYQVGRESVLEGLATGFAIEEEAARRPLHVYATCIPDEGVVYLGKAAVDNLRECLAQIARRTPV